MIACAMVRSFTMRRVDEQVLGPARRVPGRRQGPPVARRIRRRPPPPCGRATRSGRARRTADRCARAATRPADTAATVARRARQREADLGIRERELRHDPRDLRRLGGVGLQELAPRRQVVEEIVHLDASCPRGMPTSTTDATVPPLTRISVPLSLAARPGPQHEVRHRGDRRQRLAAEPQRRESRRDRPARRSCSSRAARARAARRPAPCPRRRPRRGPASCRRSRLTTAIRRAPASSAFSTSSLTTDAGRSTTSPAAIWLARSERKTMDFGHQQRLNVRRRARRARRETFPSRRAPC